MSRKSFVALFVLALALSVFTAGAGLSQAQPEPPSPRNTLPAEAQPGSAAQPPGGAIQVNDGLTGSLPPQSPEVVWLWENFEGTWPTGDWYLEDVSDSVDGNDYLFGKRNCQPQLPNSSFAGWVVGGGAIGSQLGCNSNYPNNLNTWAMYGPITLSGASHARLNWDMTGNSQPDGDNCRFDFLWLEVSTDGSFDGPYAGAGVYGDRICDDHGGLYWPWQWKLNDFLGQTVYIGFAMYSNGSVTERGYIVDNISVDSCQIPTAPALLAPAHGSSITDNTPTFSWTAPGGATAYRLLVYDNADHVNPVISEYPLSTTQYTPGVALAPETYDWYVQAYNNASGCDAFGEWSAASSFTITAGPTCYQLTLDHTGSGGNPTPSPAASAGCANGRYVAGEAISLTASPANGWRVNGWQGTNNNGSTSISNTATMPAANHTVRVNYAQSTTIPSRAFLPSIHYGLVGWVGPFEAEPNNDISQANGPMVIGRAYQAFPNDKFDYFYFELGQQRTVVVAMTNNVVTLPQLQLTPPNAAPVSDTVGPEFKIVYPNAPPGRYYIRTAAVNNTSNTAAYTLLVTTQ